MKKRNRLFLFLLLLILSFLLCSCKEEPVSEYSPPDNTQKGSRNNEPVLYQPVADGIETYSCNVATLDTSHTADGYMIADYYGTNEKVKLQITGPDAVTYTHDLHGGQEVFPLTAGSGSYTIGVFENTSGTQYATAMSQTIEVSLSDPLLPFLYPSQYVNFTPNSPAVEKASELSYSANSDIEVVENIYNYIINEYTYDYDKASTVKNGYLPNVDEIFASQTGICFDYAAVITTMLRSQNIPTRLEVGYMEDQYHAWISVYMKDEGWINGVISFDGSNWNMLDPTFASTSSSPSSFTADEKKYTTIYIY